MRWSPHNVWTLLHSELLVLQLMWRIICFNTGIAVYRKLVWSFSACVGRCICPFTSAATQKSHCVKWSARVAVHCSPQPAVISSPPGVSLLAVFINNSVLTKNWNTCFKSDESSQELEYECGISSVFVLKLRLFSIRTAFPSFSVAVDSWKLWQYFRVWSKCQYWKSHFLLTKYNSLCLKDIIKTDKT